MARRKDGISCTAKAKSTGVQCGNPPVPGLNVCRIHGGATKRSQAASARKILRLLVGPALAALRELLLDPATPASVKLAAIKDILDRDGWKAPERIEVLTMGRVEAEIERLEAELGIHDGTGT